jgi:hypothetical protein
MVRISCAVGASAKADVPGQIRAILLDLRVRDTVCKGQFWGELNDWALRTFGSGAQFIFLHPFLRTVARSAIRRHVGMPFQSALLPRLNGLLIVL